MTKHLRIGVVAALAAALGILGPTPPASAAGTIPVVDIAVVGSQATVSQTTMRPGVVEFHVGRTVMIPGPDAHPDPLSVIATDHLDVIAAALPAVFTQSDDPAALAGAAQGMRTIHAAGTFYGGGTKGTTWRVYLNPGTYTVIGAESLATGLGTPVTFTVAGAPRAGSLPATQATVRAAGPVGDNRWTFRQTGAPVQWLRFTNAAKELHFLDMSGVKPGTTSAQVKKALFGNAQPTFFTDAGLHFDVVSPGVSVAVKGPIAPGDYLLDCFIPSESDGMPHALMGMWKLITVR